VIGRGRPVIAIAVALLAPASALGSPTDPVQPTDPAPFILHDAGTWAANEAIVADLAKGMPSATVAAVVSDANRSTRTLGGVVSRVGKWPMATAGRRATTR
jgi:hypothetical protein